MKLKLLRDCIELNAFNGVAFATITLADLQAVSAILLTITSIVCTIIVARHKTKD